MERLAFRLLRAMVCATLLHCVAVHALAGNIDDAS